MPRKYKPGTIIRINLDKDYHTYARELIPPFIAVYDAKTTKPLGLEKIIQSDVLFIIGVFARAFKHWRKVGYIPLNSNEIPIPDRFHQNQANLLDCSLVDIDGNRRPATIAECEGREPESVYDSYDVLERIIDHYAGRPNILVESQKVKQPTG